MTTRASFPRGMQWLLTLGWRLLMVGAILFSSAAPTYTTASAAGLSNVTAQLINAPKPTSTLTPTPSVTPESVTLTPSPVVTTTASTTPQPTTPTNATPTLTVLTQTQTTSATPTIGSTQTQTPSPTSVANLITPLGGTVALASTNSTLTLNFPAGAVTDATLITLGTMADTAHLPSNAAGLGLAYRLLANTQPGQPVTHFRFPLTVSLHYSPAVLNGIAESQLLLATSSDDGATWQSLPTTINLTTHIASGLLAHFSLLTLIALPNLALPAPIVLAPASQPVASAFNTPPSAPQVVYARTVSVNYSDGVKLLLSSTADGQGELLSDDAVRLQVTNSAGNFTYQHDYWDATAQAYLPTGPADVTALFRPGANTVTLEILDSRPSVTWTEGYQLVQPRNPFALTLGGEGPTLFGADVIDLSTGNYLRRETDLDAPAPGLAVSFTRTYNSYDDASGAFGFGWSSPYDSRATVYVDGSVEIKSPVGRRTLFLPNGSGGFTPEPGVLDTLSVSASGSEYILTQKTTLIQFHFDAATGRLIHITEPHGNSVTIAYSGNSPASLTDSAGRVYPFTADSAGRITSITDPAGEALAYTYNSAGDLVRYTDRLGENWLYTYDAVHRLLTVTSPDNVRISTNVYAANGRLLQTTDGAGQNWTATTLPDGRTAFSDGSGALVMIVTHDDRYRVVAVEDANHQITRYTYNAQDLLTSITNPVGQTTTYAYDAAGNLISTTDALGQTTQISFNTLNRPDQIVDALGAITQYTYSGADLTHIDLAGVMNLSLEYDARGNITRLTNGAGQFIKYTYDAQGNRVSATNSLGQTETYTYDALGRMVSRTDASGKTTRLTYDANGNLISTTDPNGASDHRTYDSQGRLTSYTNALGNTWTWEYNGNGKLLKATDAEGAKTVYTYDARGNLIRVTDPLGNSTSYTYNNINYLETMTDAAGNITHVTHDALGRVTSTTDQAGGVWALSYDALDRVAVQIDPLGHRQAYHYDAVGNMTALTDEDGHTTTYTYDGAKHQTSITDPLGGVTTYVYNAAGQRVSQTLPNHAVTTYTYDTAGRLIQTKDALGNLFVQTYTPNGDLATSADPLGRTTTYVYDANRRLVSVTDALGGVWHFGYDAAGNRVTQTDANGHTRIFAFDKVYRLIHVTDALGGTTAYTYDLAGNLLSTTDPSGATFRYAYDKLNRQVSITDALGGQTRLAYDAVGNLVRYTNALNHMTRLTYDARHLNTAITDALGGVTQLDYDPVGNLLKETDANHNSTLFAYDALNQLVRTTDALGGVTALSYDSVGNLVSATRPNGATTQMAYDSLSRLTTTTDALGGVNAFAYDPVGNLISRTDPNGHTTTLTYDALNRQIGLKDPLGFRLTQTYDAVGNRVSQTDKRSNTWTYAYDAVNNLTQITDPLGGQTKSTYTANYHLSSRTNPNGATTRYAYDLLNRPTLITDALGGQTALAYDAIGNLLARTDANGHTSYFTYDPLNRRIQQSDPLGNVTRSTYDALGRQIGVTDANGHTTQYTYDALGRLMGARDAIGGQTTYAYDTVGNLTAFTDANQHTTRYAFDRLNRQTGETDPLGNTWAYAYDPAGNLISRTDARHQTTTYSYDALNRKVKTQYPDQSRVTFGYDPNNNLTRVTNTASDLLANYDALNRLTVIGPAANPMSYIYDRVGNTLQIRYPNGDKLGYTYDALNQQTSLTDPLGQKTTYVYDPVGNLVQTNYANGLRTAYGYDAANRLVNVQSVNNRPAPAGGTVLYQDALTLDPVGNPLAMVESFTQGTLRKINHTYTYDALDRLLGDKVVQNWPAGASFVTSYTYDAVGNRFSKSVQMLGNKPSTQTTLATYDAANERLQSGNIRFSYDANGNLTQAAAPERTQQYQYNFEDELVGYTRLIPQGKNGQFRTDLAARYAYDGLGRRVQKSVKDSGQPKVTNYLYDGFSYNPLEEIANPGQTTELYWGAGGLAETRETQSAGRGLVYYRQPNWRGDVALISNQSGQSVHAYFYSAYGQLLDNNGKLQDSSNFTGPHNPFTLTGKELDPESGLTYFGARYYNAAQENWLTRDPLPGPLTDPLQRNHYLFDRANPMRYVDLIGASIGGIPCGIPYIMTYGRDCSGGGGSGSGGKNSGGPPCYGPTCLIGGGGGGGSTPLLLPSLDNLTTGSCNALLSFFGIPLRTFCSALTATTASNSLTSSAMNHCFNWYAQQYDPNCRKFTLFNNAISSQIKFQDSATTSAPINFQQFCADLAKLSGPEKCADGYGPPLQNQSNRTVTIQKGYGVPDSNYCSESERDQNGVCENPPDHAGTDFCYGNGLTTCYGANTRWQPVSAIANGMVIHVDPYQDQNRHDPIDALGEGGAVIIATIDPQGGVVFITYRHLDPTSIASLKEGTWIDKGQQVGTVTSYYDAKSCEPPTGSEKNCKGYANSHVHVEGASTLSYNNNDPAGIWSLVGPGYEYGALADKGYINVCTLGSDVCPSSSK